MTFSLLSTYGGLDFEKGYDGQLCDSNPSVIVSLSYAAQKNDRPIPFGSVVVRASQDNTCALPAQDTDHIIGIALGRLFYQDHYPPLSCVPVLRSGFVWVTPAENVRRGESVVAFTDTEKRGQLGAGNPGKGRIQIPNAIWETNAFKGQKAKLRINT